MEDLDEPDSGIPGKSSQEDQAASPQQPLHVSMLCTVLLEELCVVSQLAGLQSEAELSNVTASISTKHLVPAPGEPTVRNAPQQCISACLWEKKSSSMKEH